MTEIINTCSGTISLAKKLEKDSSDFYERAAERDVDNKGLFLSFAEENRKFVTQIERAYYGVISDAIEGCFAFNLNRDDHEFNLEMPGGVSLSVVVEKAIEIEKKMTDFYNTAAEQSKSLMADVPRAFKMVVKKRIKREDTLKALLRA